MQENLINLQGEVDKIALQSQRFELAIVFQESRLVVMPVYFDKKLLYKS